MAAANIASTRTGGADRGSTGAVTTGAVATAGAGRGAGGDGEGPGPDSTLARVRAITSHIAVVVVVGGNRKSPGLPGLFHFNQDDAPARPPRDCSGYRDFRDRA